MASSEEEMVSNEPKTNERGDDNKEDAATPSNGEESLLVQEETHGKCFIWMTRHHLGWLARIPGEWPRTTALVFGVIIPLFVLIAVSLFFGYGLAKLEAPNEVDANNEILANRAYVAILTSFQANLTQALPRMCLAILALNKTDDMNATLEEGLSEIYLKIIDRSATTNEVPFDLDEFDKDLLPSNTTQLLDFTSECGKLGFEIGNTFAPELAVDYDYIGEDLTFGWIRCDGLDNNSSGNLLNQIWGRPYVDRWRLRPDEQEADVVAAWRLDARGLYTEKFDELVERNETSLSQSRVQAVQYSITNANGFGHCYPNSAAGAWFWFTVMTTIGYGNTAPKTEGGRAMIYTLGFFSILLFAIILGTAGSIVVTIWDDFINRTKLHQLNIPWVACLFWGFCYYAWMLVIAVVTQNWKAQRLGEDMHFNEAYWFSYISTTTVGLGDYYLEHEVILREDLFTFPVMFLTGFVLLANFFVKLTELISNLVPRHKLTLEEMLAMSNAPCLPAMSPARLRELRIKHAERIRSHHFLSRHKDAQDESDELHDEIGNQGGIATAVVEAESGNAVAESASPSAEPLEVADGTGTGTTDALAPQVEESAP